MITEKGEDTWAAAIGTGEFTNGTVDAGLSATEGVAAAYYNATAGQAVFGYVLNTSTGANGGVANQIDAADTFVEITKVTMAAQDFTGANIDAAYLAF